MPASVRRPPPLSRPLRSAAATSATSTKERPSRSIHAANKDPNASSLRRRKNDTSQPSSPLQTLDTGRMPRLEALRIPKGHFKPALPEKRRSMLGTPYLKLSDLKCVTQLGEGAWAKIYAVEVKKRRAWIPRRYDALIVAKTVRKRTIRDVERNDSEPDRELLSERKSRELHLLSKIPWHPFIASALDAFTDSRNTYILLEYAPCGSMHQRLHHTGRMSVEHAKFYFANVVLAVEFLHTHGIVHCDIKTENILIGADGYLMITDFGLSLAQDSRDWGKATAGTPQYMSPEVLMQEFGTLERRRACDWWAAAVLLYEMITVSDAVKAADFQAILDELQDERQVSYLAPFNLPPDILDFFTISFKFDIEQRGCYRSEPLGDNQGLVNAELRAHPFVECMPWDRIERRLDVAPWVPVRAPNPVRDWAAPTLPKQSEVPGIRLKRPASRFANDELLDAYRPGKKQKRR